MTELDVKKMPKNIKSVRTWAKWTAAWIRKNGHWQGRVRWDKYPPKFLWGYTNPDGLCCLIVNPAFNASNFDNESFLNKFEMILKSNKLISAGNIVTWQDTTPTEEVLEKLDAVAKGKLK